ncbi:hypothetical protein, partial [Vibrio campbellii]|uniref:hypothetical protein n=1 Tax=Vibrio campbellii TaxID=680 RepID=UPI000AC503DE
SASCYSFSVDNMILIANEDNNAILTISSTSEKPEYIKGFINKIDVVDGEVKKTKLTKDNLPLWDMALIPNKVILNPGERRRLAIKNLCRANCESDTDKMYQIVLLPAVHDDSSSTAVGINLGYAPVLVVPTKMPSISYSFDYMNDNLKIDNSGNTLLYVRLDNCTQSVTAECSETYTVLAGRSRQFKLPVGVIGANSLKLRVASHDYTYNEVVYVYQN